MAFDIEMIKEVYTRMTERVDTAKKVVGKGSTTILPNNKNIFIFF